MLEVTIQKRLDGFLLDVAFAVASPLTVLFGPSGSGKSLTLQAIAGTVAADSGRISIDGQTVYDSARQMLMSPQVRRVGYVPQHYALFPHLTVESNIGFGLTSLSRGERLRRIGDLLHLFHLQGLAHRYPRELSGGQQQRVALARALAVDPRLLLLDEPFAALDAPLRAALRQELTQIQQRLGISIILVSHDLADAFAFGQQVIVYDKGRVIQQGPREQVFFHPATRRVAELVGTTNILPAEVERSDADTLWVRWQGRRLAVAPGERVAGVAIFLCVRPTQILIIRPEQMTKRQRENLLSGQIVGERMEGENYTLHVRLDESEAPYDLEILLPAYVYHRLLLDTEKHVTLELRRQVLHVIPRE